MFRGANEFSVFRNGYEYAEGNLAQYRSRLKFAEILDSFSGAPDFLLVKDDKSEASAYLVEVKYRSQLDEKELVSIAKKIVERWDHSYLFIISKHGFHFSPANAIINTHGRIEALGTSWIPQVHSREISRTCTGLSLGTRA
jgi:hypothetical protein